MHSLFEDLFHCVLETKIDTELHVLFYCLFVSILHFMNEWNDDNEQ